MGQYLRYHPDANTLSHFLIDASPIIIANEGLGKVKELHTDLTHYHISMLAKKDP